jgi:hypothetical protein
MNIENWGLYLRAAIATIITLVATVVFTALYGVAVLWDTSIIIIAAVLKLIVDVVKALIKSILDLVGMWKSSYKVASDGIRMIRLQAKINSIIRKTDSVSELFEKARHVAYNARGPWGTRK